MDITVVVESATLLKGIAESGIAGLISAIKDPIPAAYRVGSGIFVSPRDCSAHSNGDSVRREGKAGNIRFI